MSVFNQRKGFLNDKSGGFEGKGKHRTRTGKVLRKKQLESENPFSPISFLFSFELSGILYMFSLHNHRMMKQVLKIGIKR